MRDSTLEAQCSANMPGQGLDGALAGGVVHVGGVGGPLDNVVDAQARGEAEGFPEE